MLSQSQGKWLERDDIEEDPTWRQIIPYVLIGSDDNTKAEPCLFVYQRKGGGEKRLDGKFSLGIGGHIEEQDAENGCPVLDGAYREVNEEIKVRLDCFVDINPVPMFPIVLSGNMVNDVHVGLVYSCTIVDGHKSIMNIEAGEDCIDGKMMTIPEIFELQKNVEFEDWSQYIIDRMKK